MTLLQFYDKFNIREPEQRDRRRANPRRRRATVQGSAAAATSSPAIGKATASGEPPRRQDSPAGTATASGIAMSGHSERHSDRKGKRKVIFRLLFLLISSDFRKGKTTAAKKKNSCGARSTGLPKKKEEMNTRPSIPGAAVGVRVRIGRAHV